MGDDAFGPPATAQSVVSGDATSPVPVFQEAQAPQESPVLVEQEQQASPAKSLNGSTFTPSETPASSKAVSQLPH